MDVMQYHIISSIVVCCVISYYIIWDAAAAARTFARVGGSVGASSLSLRENIWTSQTKAPRSIDSPGSSTMTWARDGHMRSAQWRSLPLAWLRVWVMDSNHVLVMVALHWAIGCGQWLAGPRKQCWQKPCWQIYAHWLRGYVGASARVTAHHANMVSANMVSILPRLGRLAPPLPTDMCLCITCVYCVCVCMCIYIYI